MRHCAIGLLSALCCLGADVSLLPDYVRMGPFGDVVAADASTGIRPAKTLQITAARGGYASCRIVVSGAGAYDLSVNAPFDAELHREWFHQLQNGKGYYPDALIPVKLPHRASLPEADNQISGQKVQTFWLDLWIPPDAKPGAHSATVNDARIALMVLPAVVPAKDAVVIDHNAYGTSWFTAQYPKLAARLGDKFYLSDEFFSLIHAYHRVFYEHRGVFHQLGYGHGGRVGVEFAPKLEGTGRTRKIADWTLFEKHYGPLLDGSAFNGSRLGAKPIPYVYLPVNPEWPAQYVNWGEAGYEREFVNVVSAMEKHFREKGWTQTKFELFFNHKKRYKAFEWDGDETRFLNDLPVFREYKRLLDLAVPEQSPVQFVFRTDASWQMERQFRDQAGVINFWVLGGGMFNWYADALPTLKARGDIVWIYGGTPTIDQPASHITTDVLRAWIIGVDGFVRWQTVLPGNDPWFKFGGGGETLVYPGDRLGIAKPLPSIRLKLERNALQDLALLNTNTDKPAVAKAFNNTSLADWRGPRPKLADGDPLEWNNVTIDEATAKDKRFEDALDAAAWNRVHTYVMKLAAEVKQ